LSQFDAVLVLSFGGPEKHEDVIPFLENVLRGRNVPRERMLEVAEHYYHFDGRSPINDQNRELLDHLRTELAENGPALPVYWGNRNWHPYLADAIRDMHSDGIANVAVFVTSAFGSYSGCRQYREDMLKALEQTGLPMNLQKLPNFALRPEYIGIMAERVLHSKAELPAASELIFTAHSIPMTMADSSPYVQQLQECCRRTAEASGFGDAWTLVYQSRSGPPSQPWLEPDILAHLKHRYEAGVRDVIVCPIGFLSDHMEVLYDLDTEALALCQELGMHMQRAGTAGGHPEFAKLIRRLIEEGETTPASARCMGDCCPAPQRPPVRPETARPV
jgi:protoporphyrin/coproporphyrin ferrochelatase